MREYAPPTEEERQRAATGYILWPVAVLDMIQSRGASRWFELHIRQAAILGASLMTGFLLVMALPLIAVFALNGPSLSTVIAIYGVSFAVDAVFFVASLVYIVRLSIKASNGDHFEVPVIWSLIARTARR